MPERDLPLKCRIQRGFFVLRECGTPANAMCPVCERGVCTEHQRAYEGKMLCIECAVRKRRADEWPDHTDSETTAPSLSTYYYTFGGGNPSSNDDTFSGGGGDFGGGGAGGSWAAADGVYAYRDQFYEDPSHDLNAFSPSDFAAFDDTIRDDLDNNASDADFFDS